jgi:histidinol-phosphate aminotransferase
MPILGVPTNEPTPTHPPHFSLEAIIRPNILSLVPYRSARDDYDSGILLDANENALGPVLPALLGANQEGTGGKDGEAMPIRKEEDFADEIQGVNGSGTKVNGASSSSSSDPLMSMTTSQLASLNRYPSPTHDPLKQLIAEHRGVPSPNWVFLGVGSDEVIDLLFRVSCVPGKDVVITTPPTYGMYGVTANVNDVGVVEVPLVTEEGKFEVDIEAVSTQSFRSVDIATIIADSSFLTLPELPSSNAPSSNNPTPSSSSSARPVTLPEPSSPYLPSAGSPRTRTTRVSSSSTRLISISLRIRAGIRLSGWSRSLRTSVSARR